MSTEKIPDSIPNKEFNFEDPRQIAIYDYLKRLVGEGTASFYKDACRIMATKPLFETTTHLVGHMLREIDVSMLGVLEGITESIPKGTEDRHKKQIKIILDALGIKEDDPVALAWLEMTTAGLHGVAHRSSLDPARPVDDDFQEMWNKRNLILFNILEKFESQYTRVFNILDALSKKDMPSSEDVKKLKNNIPNNRVAYEHFFNTITSPNWLPLLEASGFFKLPPAPEEDLESRGVRFPRWPVLIYLGKVANLSPDLVVKIISEIPDTKNDSVRSGLIEVATELPREKKLELIPKIKQWMEAENQFFSSIRSINFIKSLETDNEIPSALILIKAFLGFIKETKAPEPEKVGEVIWIPPREPRSVTEKYQYARFLQGEFLPISQKDPLGSFCVLSELLNEFYTIEREWQKEEPLQDYSYISRPSVETDDHHYDNIDDSLVNSIIKIISQLTDKDSSDIKNYILELQKYKWPVFTRLVLYLLSKNPKADPDITIKYLTNLSLLDDSNFQHEYALLVDSSFDLLSPDWKKEAFEFIDKAEERKEHISKIADPVSEEQSERMVKMWQRDRLSVFDSYLEGKEKENYEKLITEFGEPTNPRTHHERNKVFVGPTSDVNAEKLSKMSPEEIIRFLTTWEPPENKYGFGSSREGLGRELNIAVKKDIPRFSTFATSFIGLDPTYVRNYIQGFSEVVQNHVVFEWAPIIDLCLWIINQPREIEGRTEKDGWDDEDPHWGWARRAVISLISNGLNNNAIPYDLHEKIWNIIEILSDDPNPTPEQELTREGTLVDDAYNLTINTVRGETMTAVVEYGLWITRLRDELPEDKRPKLAGFALFPHVQSILEKHLTDPSIAVRAVYGRYFPWILLLGREWTIDHIKDIFPTGEFNTPLYDAAWETYIRYVSVYNDVFDILREQYLEAIKNIGTKDKKENRHDRDISLVEHLMIMFWRDKLDTINIDGLFSVFWKTANEEMRAYAINFLGRSLHSLTEPIGDTEAKLLKELWEVRIKEAESTEDKKNYEKEMSGFGWWFASGKLDEDWSIKEFLRSLEISKKVNGDYSVIDRLVVLVKSKPHESIQILGKLVQRDRQQWILFGNENDLRDILSNALNSNNALAQTKTRDLINRLVAWGYPNYGSLLLPSTPPSPEII